MHVWRNIKLLDIENIFVNLLEVLVRKGDERTKPSFKEERLCRCFGRLIADILRALELKLLHLLVVEFTRVDNRHAKRLHEIRLLTKTINDGLPVILNFRENSWVGLEGDCRSAQVGLPYFLDIVFWLADAVFLHVVAAIAMHFGNHVCRKRVYYRRTHTVQTSRNFVARFVTTKFTSCVEHGENCFKRRNTGLLMLVHRNTTAIVDDADVVVRKEHDLNTVRKTTHGFVA